MFIQRDTVTVSSRDDSSSAPAITPDNAEAGRAELLRQIETSAGELESQLAALRYAGSSNHEFLDQGEARLHQLNALRSQLIGGAQGSVLAALRTAISSAVTDTHAYTADARVMIAQSAGMSQALSVADYQRATADIDRRVAQSYVQESINVAYAHDVAARHGIDISSFAHERTALDAERDAARRKGDKLGERRADALIAHNTLNTLTSETDSITDPAERQRHTEAIRDQERIVAARRAALEAQIELEARRRATQLNLAPDEAKAFVADFTKEQLQAFDARLGELKSSNTAIAAHIELETALRAAVPAVTPEHHAITAALTPDMKAKALAVAAKINTTAGSFDGLSLPPLGPSEIKLAATADAHKTVEVPPARAHTSAAVPGVGH